MHALVVSKLDNCNSLLYGLPKHPLFPLQSVQNAAARTIKFTRKFEYITLVLKELHCLPVRHHIVCKIVLVVFNGAATLRNLLHFKTSCYIPRLSLNKTSTVIG